MAGCSGVPNCTIPDHEIVPFAADPDIAGYGVVIAFVASSWLTYVSVVVAYLFIRDGISTDQMNKLDRLITVWTKRFPQWLSKSLPYFASKEISPEAVQQVVLMLSDQRLITGASILIIGYAKHCTITQYHFNIITLLGWLSFTSHQPTLMILREYLIPRPSMRHWRAIWITGLFGMLGVATIVTYNNDFLIAYGISTQCVWASMLNNFSDGWLALLVLNCFILVWGYFAVLVLLFPGHFGWIAAISSKVRGVFRFPNRIHINSSSRFVREKALLVDIWKIWKRTAISTSPPPIRETIHLFAAAVRWLIWRIITVFSFVLFLLVFTCLEIFNSNTVDIFRIYSSLLWATSSLSSLRQSAADNGMQGSENEWGFGQLLPLLLLILPLLAAWEIIYDELIASKPPSKVPAGDRQPILLTERYLSDEPSSSSIDITDATVSTRLYRRFISRRANPDTEARIALELLEVERTNNSSGAQQTKPSSSSLQFALEDEMYRSWLFKVWMLALVSFSFVGVTVGALEGYAF